MTEKEKMDAGLWYDANFDPELLAARMKAEELCAASGGEWADLCKLPEPAAE